MISGDTLITAVQEPFAAARVDIPLE